MKWLTKIEVVEGPWWGHQMEAGACASWRDCTSAGKVGGPFGFKPSVSEAHQVSP